MSKRITDINELNGVSIKDTKRMPHPADLARWTREGLYYIDADVGIFRVTGE